MKFSQSFLGINKVFLDTAPIIYYVEGTPGFGEVVREVFNLLAQGSFQAVSSPVTLAPVFSNANSVRKASNSTRFS